MKRYKIWVFLLIIVIVISNIFEVALFSSTSLISKLFVEKVPLGSPKATLYFLIIVFLTFFLLLFMLINKLLSRFVLKILISNYKYKISNMLYLESQNSYINKESSEIQTIFMADSEMIRQERYENYFSILNSTFLILFSSISLIWMSPSVFLVILGLSFLVILVSILISKKQRKIYNSISQNNADYNTKMSSTMGGLRLFHTNSKIDSLIELKKEIAFNYEHQNQKLQEKNLKISNWFNLFMLIAQLVTLVIGFLFVVINPKLLKYENLLGAQALSLNLFIAAIMLNTYLSSFNATKDIFVKKINNENSKTTNDFDNISEIKSISIQNLQVNYGDNTVIRNFNCNFTYPNKYLIAGKSGKGKSTLLKTLIGITNHNEGAIKMNEIILTKNNSQSFRNQISYIDQETYLFNDSLAFNIALSNEYDLAKIQLILKEVQLEQFLNNETAIIGGEESKMSGGQKQRIGIARALYENKPIWMVDENTSNLDEKTKELIENIILNQKQKMVLLITHNLSDQMKEKIDETIFIGKKGD